MAISMQNLEERSGKASMAGRDTSSRAGGLGMTSSAMRLNSAVGNLEDHHKIMLALQKKYQLTRSSAARADIQDELDLMQAKYDKLAELVQSENSKANGKIAEYYTAKNSIIQFGLDHANELIKQKGTEDIIATEAKFKALIDMEKRYMRIKDKMNQENSAESNIIQKRLLKVRTDIEEERRKNFLNLETTFGKKIVSLKTKINREVAKADQGTQKDIIKAEFENKISAMKKHLGDIQAVTIEGLDNVAAVYKAKANKAAEDYVIALGSVTTHPALQKMKDEDFWGDSAAGKDKFETFSNQLRYITSRIELYHKATDPRRKDDLFKAIVGSAETAGLHVKRVTNAVVDMNNVSMDAKIVSEKEVQLLEDYGTIMDNVVTTHGKAVEAGQLYNEVLVHQDDVVKKTTDEVEKLTQQYLDAMTLQEKNALAASDLAITQAKLNVEIAAGSQFVGDYNEALKKMVSMQSLKIKGDTQLLKLEHNRNSAMNRTFPILAEAGRVLKWELVALGKKLGLYKSLNEEAIEVEKGMAVMTVAQMKLNNEEANWLRGNDAKGKALDKQITLQGHIARGDAEAAKIEGVLTDAMIVSAKIKLQLLNQEKLAWKQTTEEMEKYYEQLNTNLEKQSEQSKFAQTVSDLAKMANVYTNYAEGLKDTEAKINTDHRKQLDEWNEMRTEKVINQDQYNRLELAAEKLRAAKLEHANRMALADLYRVIGREIMAYAARKAAQAGNIVGAIAILAGGAMAMAKINAAARSIENKAERAYGTAEREFEKTQEAILGEGEDAGPQTAAGSRKFGGTIKAESLDVTISPTVVISGDSIFIGQGSVTEFQSELQQLILESTQQAIDNREVDLSGVVDIGN